MIIYPPLIAEQIPAFTGSGISVPFTWNPAVPKDDNISIRLQVKDYFTSKVICHSNKDVKATLGTAFFEIPINEEGKEYLSVGRYYKIQIAYVDGDDGELTYSSAVLGKYIEKPAKVAITNGSGNNIDDNTNNPVVYCGLYERTQYNEPLYSYCFTFRNSYGEIIETTGEVVWDNENDIKTTDETYASKPSYTLKTELEADKLYTMTFEVRTVNNYSGMASVTVSRGSAPGADCEFDLIASTNEEDGYIELSLANSNGKHMNKSFYLERSIKGSNVWELLTTLAFGSNAKLPDWSWKDFSAEIGTPYIYRIRRFRDGVVSAEVSSVNVTQQGEHIYLSDGDRCLKVKYNPKITSFKTTILEQKTDTIGGKYPFFARNDAVSYKEIPISGLISYHMDKNNYFWNRGSAETAVRQATPAQDQTTALDETELERTFKLEVLDWLNNGKPKLFRSAQEGNYIVRLMNVSLSPNDTTGRMIHSFSCTGYECADCTFENMQELDLIRIDEITPTGDNYDNASATTTEDLANDIIVPYVKNISWYCSIPYVNADYPAITLTTEDDQTIELAANTGKIIETPKDTIYKKMVIHKGIPNSAFYWSYDTDVYNKVNDNDSFAYKGSTEAKFKWTSNPKINQQMDGYHIYKNVKYLIIQANPPSDWDKAQLPDGCKLEYWDKEEEAGHTSPSLLEGLEDGQIRYYKDLKAFCICNAGQYVYITLCYEKEVATNASQDNTAEQ